MTASTGHQAPASGKAPTGFQPAGVRGGGTGGAPGVGAPPEPPRLRDADAVARQGIGDVLDARYGPLPAAVRNTGALAALDIAATWCHGYRRQLRWDREHRPAGDRQQIDAELDRLATLGLSEPHPIYQEVVREPGSPDPHRERIVADVSRQLAALIGGLAQDEADRVACAIVDRLGVA